MLQLENHRPDLVVLGDFEGPGTAARLLGALRTGAPPFHGLCAETPAIVLAEDGGKLALLRAFEAGADDFVVKPASYLELRARIRAVIARSQGERARRSGASGRSRSTPRGTAPHTRAARWASPGSSSRCSPNSASGPPASTPKRSCCATSGATRAPVRAGPSTPTRAG